MKLPFSRSDFFLVFEHYNESVWPAQAFLNLLGLMSVLLGLRKGRDASRGVLVILAVLWMWMGIVYHAVFFAAINPAATLMGAIFVAQGLVFVFLAMRSVPIVFAPSNTPVGTSAALQPGVVEDLLLAAATSALVAALALQRSRRRAEAVA